MAAGEVGAVPEGRGRLRVGEDLEVDVRARRWWLREGRSGVLSLAAGAFALLLGFSALLERQVVAEALVSVVRGLVLRGGGR